MTIVSLQPEKSGREGTFRVEFSNGSSFLFVSDYLPEGFDPVFLRKSEQFYGEEPASRELAAGDEEAFCFAAACYRAEKAALRLIARAEQNSPGLTVKLERRGYDTAVAKAVVSGLLDRNLLDDRRYAELWIRSRLSTKKVLSPRRLLVSLAKRGIYRASSLEAMKTVLDEETEFILLLQYVEKVKPQISKKAISIKNQLKNEGFSLIVIDRYLDTF